MIVKSMPWPVPVCPAPAVVCTQITGRESCGNLPKKQECNLFPVLVLPTPHPDDAADSEGEKHERQKGDHAEFLFAGHERGFRRVLRVPLNPACTRGPRAC
jgi:hypothetical protein